MNCPECGKNLGDGSDVDLSRHGWCCLKCKIKIYKEIL